MPPLILQLRAMVNTVLPLKIVTVETGVPGEKPQGYVGYLA